MDVLIELEPNHTIGLFRIAQMEIDLSELMGEVALRTPQDLSRNFRDKVVAEALVRYERNLYIPLRC